MLKNNIAIFSASFVIGHSRAENGQLRWQQAIDAAVCQLCIGIWAYGHVGNSYWRFRLKSQLVEKQLVEEQLQVVRNIN